MIALSPIAIAALLLAGVNAFQAVTGKRLSKKRSVRSDAQMRRESAIAATVLAVVAVIALFVSLS